VLKQNFCRVHCSPLQVDQHDGSCSSLEFLVQFVLSCSYRTYIIRFWQFNVRSHNHIPRRFNHADWRSLARRTANLNRTGHVTTVFDWRFTRRQVLNVIEDTIASPGLSYIQGASEVFEKSYLTRIAQKVFWNRQGNLQHQILHRLRVVTIPGMDARTRRTHYQVVIAYPK